RLGDGIIDVDRGPKKLAVAFHQIKPVDTGCGLLAHAFDGVAAFAVPAGNEGKPLLDRGEENFFFLIAWLVEKSRVARLGTHTEVNEHGGVATVVQNEVRRAAVAPLEDFMCVIPI